MKTELNLPWTYQEKADAYTHILRGPTNTFILQGRQISDGSEERKMRFIAEACSHYESVKEQLSALQQENKDLSGKVEFYRSEMEKLRDYCETNKIGKPNQKLLDAIYEHLEWSDLEIDKLRKFKQYVHERLDDMGIPADPEPENNAKHGCRIEGRLNLVGNLIYPNTAS